MQGRRSHWVRRQLPWQCKPWSRTSNHQYRSRRFFRRSWYRRGRSGCGWRLRRLKGHWMGTTGGKPNGLSPRNSTCTWQRSAAPRVPSSLHKNGRRQGTGAKTEQGVKCELHEMRAESRRYECCSPCMHRTRDKVKAGHRTRKAPKALEPLSTSAGVERMAMWPILPKRSHWARKRRERTRRMGCQLMNTGREG